MPTRTYEIKTYKPVFDAALGYITKIALIDREGIVRCDVAVLEGSSRSYEPRVNGNLESAAAFVNAQALPQLLDFLRHESNLKLTLDDTPPGDVRIHT
ncbi:MAG: hypothetical protein ACRDAM_07105 [Casimicrobium sp.]